MVGSLFYLLFECGVCGLGLNQIENDREYPGENERQEEGETGQVHVPLRAAQCERHVISKSSEAIKRP